jgi:hypothetical protein
MEEVFREFSKQWKGFGKFFQAMERMFPQHGKVLERSWLGRGLASVEPGWLLDIGCSGGW